MSATIQLDGADIGFYHLIQEIAFDQVHIGMKVSAVWASEGERTDLDPRAEGRLIGWIPTGEPDVEDPNLVNRMP